jgi:hypothetical protein
MGDVDFGSQPALADRRLRVAMAHFASTLCRTGNNGIPDLLFRSFGTPIGNEHEIEAR